MNNAIIIDLTKEESNFPLNNEPLHKISKFPDHQQDVWITPAIKDIAIQNHRKIIIQAHFNSWLDLELIACAKASLNEMGCTEVHLYIPYFLGARSDRKFSDGGTWYLKDVVCPIINGLNFTTVEVLDPHSDVLGNLIKNIKIIKNYSYVEKFIKSIYDNNIEHITNNSCIISPDAGAEKKIYDVSEKIKYPGQVFSCYKVRNKEGRVEKTIVTQDDFKGLDCFIVDDICDGGRTFIELSKELKKRNCGNVYLIISHGIFSKGYDILREHFTKVFCTNSISDIDYQDGFVVQENVLYNSPLWP